MTKRRHFIRHLLTLRIPLLNYKNPLDLFIYYDPYYEP